MRIIALLAVLAVASPAVADGFADLVGGVALPLANDQWTNTTDTSAKLGLHAGAVGSNGLGGLLAIDFSPESLANSGGSLGGSSLNISMFRFRILAQVTAQHRFSKLMLAARAGAGIDIAHESVSGNLGSLTSSSSGTDVGYALEFGGGAWFDLSDKLQLGGEVAVPIGHHDGTDGNFKFQWTSWDLDLLVGLRFWSR